MGGGGAFLKNHFAGGIRSDVNQMRGGKKKLQGEGNQFCVWLIDFAAETSGRCQIRGMNGNLSCLAERNSVLCSLRKCVTLAINYGNLTERNCEAM